jgi:hypothetical protein
MHFVGVDLHKQTISVCVMIQAGTTREVIARRRFRCADVDRILTFFEELGPFEVVVRPTTSEWRRSSYFASWRSANLTE